MPYQYISDTVTDILGTALGGLILFAIIIFIGPAIATWLWGLLMVPIFGAPPLTFWQMFGLMILLRLLIPTSSSTSTTSKK